MLANLAADVERLAAGADGRFLLGIAGPPASGKSTLAEQLAARIPNAVMLPMDGFHLDDGILEARGHRSRKGAPHTFDAAGFVALLERLKSGAHVYAPSFDRDLEISRAGAIEIGTDSRIVIVEGNWLLYDQDGWPQVRRALDACWYLDIPEEELIARLEARWLHHGKTLQEGKDWIAQNDLPNARLAAATKTAADRVLTMDALNG